MSVDFHIEVDYDHMEEVFDTSSEIVEKAMDELAEEVEWLWRRLVTQEKFSNLSKRKYLDAITVTRDAEGITLSLSSEFAVALETGSDRFDLKPGFLQGSQYKVIPIVRNSDSGQKEFRTVSKNSSGWIHPGIKANKVTSKIEGELSSGTIDSIFSRLMSRSSF